MLKTYIWSILTDLIRNYSTSWIIGNVAKSSYFPFLWYPIYGRMLKRIREKSSSFFVNSIRLIAFQLCSHSESNVYKPGFKDCFSYCL